MKVRIGFVSNSSTSSFCMYGWNKNQLTDEQYTLIKSCDKINVEDFYASYDTYVGVGNQESDLHFEDEDTDYLCDGPTLDEKIKIDELAKLYKLPEPSSYGQTWYNG